MEWRFFQEVGSGLTPQEAYLQALNGVDCREDVQYHHEYTPHGRKKKSGTMSDAARGYAVIELPPGLHDVQRYIDSLRNDESHFIHDKSLRSACLSIGGMQYIFFGFAPFEPEFEEEYKRMIALNLPCYSTDESRTIWLRDLESRSA